MTDRELDKARKLLPLGKKKYADWTDDEKKLSAELSCRDMINSILAYNWHGETADEIVAAREADRWNYLDKFINGDDMRPPLGRERVVELVQEQMDDIDSVVKDTATDSEGISYNSIKWKRESCEKKVEEAKPSKPKRHAIDVDALKKFRGVQESKCNEAERPARSNKAEQLFSKAQHLYDIDADGIDFAEKFSPKELAELWAACMISAENPFGQSYDDEVYDAIQYLGDVEPKVAEGIMIAASNIYDRKYHKPQGV